MPTWTNLRPSDPFMTVALLIALAGSLAAMADCPATRETMSRSSSRPPRRPGIHADQGTFLLPGMYGTVR